MAGANGHLRATGAAVLNDLFHSYGHAEGYLYDFDEVVRAAGDAGLLSPEGDCDVERTAFRESRWRPDVARDLDDPVKAAESLYVDIVCGAARRRRRAEDLL